MIDILKGNATGLVILEHVNGVWINTVMEFLAFITIVLSLPILVTSYFGMHVSPLLQSNKFAFMLILGICFAISGLVIPIYVRRDWF